MDNYAAHQRAEVPQWPAVNPRIAAHFTPTPASKLNLVEVWCAITERQAIHRDPHLHQRLELPHPPLGLDQNLR
jgi:hypothetical protein